MGDEYIPFEITDHDLEAESNPYSNHRMSKNQRIYGIWADEESDENESSERNSSKYSKKVKKNYTAPINFVSGGIQKPSEKPKEVDNDNDEGADENVPIISDSSDEELTRPTIGTTKKNKPNLVFDESQMAGFRRVGGSRLTNSANQGIGGEKVRRMMAMMGFQEGKGLGKHLQGINAPIEAELRRGRGAIGAYGPEKKQKKVKSTNKEEEQEEDEASERPSLWKKKGHEKKLPIKYNYITADEVIEESKRYAKRKTDTSLLSKVKVIDMTGPEQRVLSGYHAIAGVQKPVSEWEMPRGDRKYLNFNVPELLHNLDILADMSQEDIIENDRKIKYAEDRLKVLEEQTKNLRVSLSQDRKIKGNMKNVLDALETIFPSSGTKVITLIEAEEVFSKLKANHYNEYQYFRISELAVKTIQPLINNILVNWQPLRDPNSPIHIFEKWQNILMDNNCSDSGDITTTNPYYKLIWTTWVPCIRKAVEKWECRNWSPMVNLIVSWMPLISKPALDNILEEMILNRIQYQVQEWNPLTDVVPIDAWISPWVKLLNKHFETMVYPTIRQKLCRALTNWHPSDKSAKIMLQAWNKIFNRGVMDAFLVNNIVPKLHTVLNAMQIHPNEQSYDQWNWTMDWVDLIQPETMASLLDKSFFPKWIQTLNNWLSMPGVNKQEVAQWYITWKQLIPSNILQQPIIQDNLNRALKLMSATTTIPRRPVLHNRTFEQPSISVNMNNIPMNIKTVMENHCAEKGIEFYPIANRYFDGRQVYQCGSNTIYFEKNVIFCSQGGGTFTQTSFDEAVERAR